MKLKKDSTEQKLRGAYYTPQQLATDMVRLFETDDIKSVLEPSCGDGVFLDALSEARLLGKIHSIEAVEIEEDEVKKVRGRYDNAPQVRVFNEDFFDFYKEKLGKKTYDLVLGIILTPILMSILSSENAQRFNQSKTYFTLDLLIGWHSTLLSVLRP